MTAVPAIMHKPRLSRLAQLFARRPIYFLTLCTLDRKMILARADIHSAFVDFCQKAGSRGMHVGRYVLMPDHIHLFSWNEIEGLSLSDWVKSLKNTLSKAWRSTGDAGPHWQKGFFDHVLRSADSYEQKWNYVVANPVRAGLTTATDEWPYQRVIEELVSSRRS